MDELWRMLRDPRVSIALMLVTAAVAGFALMLIGYRDIAAEVIAPAQTPYLISCSLTGIAILGTGLRLLSVHVDRVEAATERRELARLQREALRILAAAHEDESAQD